MNDRDSIAQRIGFVEIMRGEKNRSARSMFEDHVPNASSSTRIDAGRRFVENDRTGTGNEGDAH